MLMGSPELVKDGDTLDDVFDRLGTPNSSDYGEKQDDNRFDQVAVGHRTTILKEIADMGAKVWRLKRR